MSVNSKMTAIADPIRTLSGTTAAMGLDAMVSNLDDAVSEVDAQAGLIQQIKTALDGKAGGGGGGVPLPSLSNPGTAADLVEGKQLIDANGNIVAGAMKSLGRLDLNAAVFEVDYEGDLAITLTNDDKRYVDGNATLYRSGAFLGRATPEDVATGKTFSSIEGIGLVGTAAIGGGGMVIKTGTTTSGTINTGLSDIEAFFIYKETQTETGLIHLSYTKDGGTSRMYASAWSTNAWGSKTITSGTGGTSVSGGTFTISATSATSGGLSSNVTYKWIAIGTA